MSANLKTEQIILRIVGGRFSRIPIMAITTSGSVSVGSRRSLAVKGLVHENVMFPPDAVRPSERLKAGPGKPDRWRTSRVAEGVCLSSHARRLPAIGTSRRLDGSGPLSALLQETRSLDSGPLPAPSPRTRPRGTAHPAAVSSSPTAPVRTSRGKR